jgi:hypothetical protein
MTEWSDIRLAIALTTCLLVPSPAVGPAGGRQCHRARRGAREPLRGMIADSRWSSSRIRLSFKDRRESQWVPSCYGRGCGPCPTRRGEASRILYARDIAAVIATVLTDPLDRHAGRIHLVTGPAALSFGEVAATFSRVLGRSVRYRNLEDEQLKTGLLAAGQSEWQATALVELNVYARQGHASVVTDAVERIAGRSATTLGQWLRDHAALFSG